MDNRVRKAAGPMRDIGSNLSLSAAGPQFAFSVLVGFGIGYGLDRWLRTGPWLMLVFIGLGIAAGVRTLLRAARSTI